MVSADVYSFQYCWMFAYSSLLTQRSYLPGVNALACAIQSSAYPFLLLLIDPQVSAEADALSLAWRSCGVRIDVMQVPPIHVPRGWIPPPSSWQAAFAGRFHESARKLNIFGQEAYARIVFVDADLLLLRPPDELFTVTFPPGAQLAAARDDGIYLARGDHDFNGGLLVVVPNRTAHLKMMEKLQGSRSLTGEQGFLHTIFAREPLLPLPTRYNRLKRRERFAKPAGLGNLSDLVGLHFVGAVKPWSNTNDSCAERRAYPVSYQLWDAHVGKCMRHPCATPAALASLGAHTLREQPRDGPGQCRGGRAAAHKV